MIEIVCIPIYGEKPPVRTETRISGTKLLFGAYINGKWTCTIAVDYENHADQAAAIQTLREIGETVQ